jgi:hypothetical protein
MAQSDNKKLKTIIISGIELNEEKFPELYQWAKDNPETLEEKLNGLIKVWHDYPATYAAGALEESLGADRNHRQVYLPSLDEPKDKEKEFEITVSSNPNLSLAEKKKIMQECVDYLLSLPPKGNDKNEGSEENQIEKIKQAKTGVPIELTGYAVYDKEGNDTGKRFVRREDAEAYQREMYGNK